MKKTCFYLYFLLLTLFAGTGYAEPADLAGVGSKPMLMTLMAPPQNDQGRKGPATARQPEQSSTEGPVKAVPITERKSKPQRVEAGGARGGARGPREVRSARGGSEAGRGAQGGGARGAGRGLGRGHGH